ncbi:PREDICTED: eukaryotic translation initiation factor 4G-like isoform X3 [Ipomoea nil]|nr:PREDICTED: eukaryotic translation initiation factor 4G-like isoform X3 [Ipomoea nil]
MLFWGGEITKNGDMGCVDYSEPPKTMCFLSHSSSYDELETKVHTAMDTNADRTRLVLFGRHPMIIPGGQTVFVPIPLTNDESWKWFLQMASVSQPIHVYATAKRRTDGQEVQLLSCGTYPRDYGNEYSSEWLSGLCSQIFNKAVMVPEFSEMFADIFYRLSSMLPEFYVNNETYSFKRLLLNQCQEEFEKGKADREFASDQEKVIHMRRRKWGNIKLIGELYKKKMLTERIIHECIKKLLGGQYEYENPDEEDVETLCHLMQTVGETIDHPKAKEHMDLYFETISKLINHPTLSSRLKEMLVHLVDLRENKWQKMGKVEGSKMFEDFHPTS